MRHPYDFGIADVTQDPAVEHALDLLEGDRREHVAPCQLTDECLVRRPEATNCLGRQPKRQRIAAKSADDQRSNGRIADPEMLQDGIGCRVVEVAERGSVRTRTVGANPVTTARPDTMMRASGMTPGVAAAGQGHRGSRPDP